MAELVLSLRDRELSRTPVTHSRVVVGRDAACDVVIDNAGVSRNHAVVLYTDDEFRVRDMDSQNGITVNGKPVKDCVLKYGDVIGIGKFEVKLLETFEDYEIETGSRQRVTAPKNVMGTMQMSASAVAGLRDEIAAKAAKKKVANGVKAPPARGAKDKIGSAAKAERAAAPKDRQKPTPPRVAQERAAAAKADEPVPPPPAANPMVKPLAIGVAVLAVAVVAALVFL